MGVSNAKLRFSTDVSILVSEQLKRHFADFCVSAGLEHSIDEARVAGLIELVFYTEGPEGRMGPLTNWFRYLHQLAMNGYLQANTPLAGIGEGVHPYAPNPLNTHASALLSPPLIMTGFSASGLTGYDTWTALLKVGPNDE